MILPLVALALSGAPTAAGFAAGGGVLRAGVLRGGSSAEGRSLPAPRMQAGGAEPLSKSQLEKTSLSAVEIHDRQWALNKLNFAAQWECDMKWYQRSSDASTTKQVLGAPPGPAPCFAQSPSRDRLGPDAAGDVEAASCPAC